MTVLFVDVEAIPGKKRMHRFDRRKRLRHCKRQRLCWAAKVVLAAVPEVGEEVGCEGV
ncbi:MAG: hypothetical protein BroJett011_33800 [Chloroflexota bacterium]|nr:MAG: hypothetical protein BroJett011_33800 [Chloroflexota bacterium]